jgi:putrescine transport system substrate-binding protein
MLNRLLHILVIGFAAFVSERVLAQDAPPAPGEEAHRSLNVLAWSDYFDPNALADFETETGIQITYDAYPSSAVLDATLAGPNTYDVIVIGGPSLQQAIALGRLQKLDKTLADPAARVRPEILSFLSAYDPGNQYAVNYTWFTTGFMFNVNLAKARLGQTLPNSWEALFRQDILKRFADCGIEMVDSPSDLISIALLALKLPPQTRNPVDLKRAADLLFRLKPTIRRFDSVDYPQALARGEICLAIGWTGEAVLARSRAQEAGNGIDINYTIPRDGTLISLDNLAIPAAAPHRAEAYQFIDFLMRPEIAARISKASGVATGILSALPRLDHPTADDPAIYPKGDVLKRLFTVPLYDRATRDFVGREWSRIKVGK